MRRCTISVHHHMQVIFGTSIDRTFQWNRLVGVSTDNLVVLASLVNLNRGYIFDETGRISWSDTWRGTSGSNVSYQRPALS